ncbi:CII family transcriptional regulator [Tatumella ptyseos]|uniref:Bacteriophage CII protein n=1 Tax=Tatumella ptyseos TaxID=82987 RepID=A0A2X5RB78_9GAMM|nr:CII family transcriptional regulator [Tatumella ptyseos]SQK75765.1 Bacteriophage CII protein [Tatumella ptyseos]
MEVSTTRNNARAIESKLLNKIALVGLTNVAKAVGVDKSQVSRWKANFIPKMSLLLAVLEWGVDDEQINDLAQRLRVLLTNERAPKNGEFFEA